MTGEARLTQDSLPVYHHPGTHKHQNKTPAFTLTPAPHTTALKTFMFRGDIAKNDSHSGITRSRLNPKTLKTTPQTHQQK